MGRRGKPEKAIKEMPKWAEDKLSGAHGFKYDITQNPQGADDDEAEDGNWQDLFSGLFSEDPDIVVQDNTPDTEGGSSSAQAADVQQLPDNEYEVDPKTLELTLTSGPRETKSEDHIEQDPSLAYEAWFW